MDNVLRKLEAGPVQVRTTFKHDVVILPSTIEDGSGIYSLSSAALVRQLRDHGLDTGYLHDPDHLVVRANLFGETATELVLGLGTAVGGAAVWASLVAAFKAVVRPKDRLRATIAVQRQQDDGKVETNWFDYSGPAEQFPESLAYLVGRKDGSGLPEA